LAGSAPEKPELPQMNKPSLGNMMPHV
jgi:hypothetical protein